MRLALLKAKVVAVAAAAAEDGGGSAEKEALHAELGKALEALPERARLLVAPEKTVSDQVAAVRQKFGEMVETNDAAR